MIIYIHGVGRQDPPDVLHARLDRILFGERPDGTRLAYYADVLHAERPPTALGRLRAAAPHRRRDGTQTGGKPTGPEPSEESRVEPSKAANMPPDQVPADDAGAFVHPHLQAFRERLQRHMDATTGDQPSWLEREGFQVLVATLLPDVGAYFFGGHGEAMREPLRRELRQVDGPLVLVSHSLGTVIAYQVLHEPEFEGIDVRHWLTVGSPLGVDEIRWLATDGRARPAPMPAGVTRWTNVADPLDPVAIDATLRDEYGPADRIDEFRVTIRSRLHHSMAAYLAHEDVRAVVVDAVAATVPPTT